MSNSNISKRLAQVLPGTLHVGVDLALDGNVAIVVDENARQCARFPQDADGYEYFLEHIEKVRQKQGASQVVVAMEPTNFFWKLLANNLEQNKITYHLVNAYTVKKHREGDQIDRSKDDPRDSFTIADLSRTGKYTETRLQRGVYEDLRQYATLYYQLMKNLRRERNILWGLVGQVFPELQRTFKAFSGATVTALLRTCPAAVSIRALSEEAFLSQGKFVILGKTVMPFQITTDLPVGGNFDWPGGWHSGLLFSHPDPPEPPGSPAEGGTSDYPDLERLPSTGGGGQVSLIGEKPEYLVGGAHPGRDR